MAKRASLEPKETTKAHAPWLVELPPGLSSTGRRERRYYKTKKEAEEFCRQQRIRLENYGTASSTLPAGKVEEAVAAFEKLQGTGASLLEAVDHFLEWRKTQNQSVTFSTMFQRFREVKASRSDAYKRGLRQTESRFAALKDKLVVEITTADIEAQLTGATPSVRNSFLRNLKAVFNFGLRREWCGKNPVSRIEMATLKWRKVILTNAEVTALLKAALDADLELLPYLLFCIFAGIRPQEVERLTWGNVNLKERYVEVPEEASKTQARRIVEMEPLLVRWLRYYKSKGQSMEGPVAPTSNLRKRLRHVRGLAGIESWPQDAPRRTYASCWLAVHDKVDRLNQLMGHTSPAMLWKHYHKAVTLKRAKAFWKIVPPAPQQKQRPSLPAPEPTVLPVLPAPEAEATESLQAA